MGDSGAQKKKLNKNKLKKTIKNVLSRPDPLIWPEVSEDHRKMIEVALSKHKVELPMYKKLHWNELKLIPKDKRPKPPKVGKVSGLLFGISECSSAIESKQCLAVIIESMVNPRVIVQSVTEACKRAHVPFICCQNLRKTTEQFFGIPTSCLGVKMNCLPDLTTTVLEVAKSYKNIESLEVQSRLKSEEIMEVDKSLEVATAKESVNVVYPYLYRSDKKSRVFVPNNATSSKISKAFVGQNYIEFTDKTKINQMDKKAYMKMMIKRISNNPNRAKIKDK